MSSRLDLTLWSLWMAVISGHSENYENILKFLQNGICTHFVKWCAEKSRSFDLKKNCTENVLVLKVLMVFCLQYSWEANFQKTVQMRKA